MMADFQFSYNTSTAQGSGGVGSPRFVVRKSKDRGIIDHGWLDTKHTFSFAGYYDRRFEGFGPLRVLNEDKVAPDNGFGTHPHREFEIFSYIVTGALRHQDSMGNQEVLPRGSIQFTSAGKGITHSEMNNSKETPVHFLQLWAKPKSRGLKPSYATIQVSDEAKTDTAHPIPLIIPVDVKAKLGGAKFRDIARKKLIGIHQDMYMFASILSPGKATRHQVVGIKRLGYVHVIESGTKSVVEVTVANGTVKARLEEGDGLFIHDMSEVDELMFTSVGKGKAEFVLLDMVKEA
ncbi:RmlC-like cupin domain-containing protein [Chytridium lagenaria]|nr:RmlC-like cupin domain-containing protein [Chytridium lagenaria]